MFVPPKYDKAASYTRELTQVKFWCVKGKYAFQPGGVWFKNNVENRKADLILQQHRNYNLQWLRDDGLEWLEILR